MTALNNAINMVQVSTIKIQTFTSTGTYTPSTGMLYCTVEICGGGGAGGSSSGSSGQGSAGAGGGGGGYCKKTYTAALIGANAAIVIGAEGTPGAAGANPGGAGGNSTFTPAGAGAVLTANGGGGGGAGTASASANASANFGAGGTGSNGDLNIEGGFGDWGWSLAGAVLSSGGAGGSSYFSTKNGFIIQTADNAGTQGIGRGSGGWGSNSASSNQQGGAGVAGYCYITEYCNQ